MQLGTIMTQAKAISEVLDFLKVPIPSAATIFAWFTGFDFLGITEAVQELGILAIILLNVWWVWHRLKLQKLENKWAKQDRYEDSKEAK